MSRAESAESDSEVASRVTVEVRLRAVSEVIDGAPVGEVADRFGVSRQTVTEYSPHWGPPAVCSGAGALMVL